MHSPSLINQFIVSLSAPALTHSVSTTFIEYRCQPPLWGGGGGCSHPSCSAKLNLLCKSRPKRENPGKKPGNSVIFSEIENKQTSAAPPFPLHAREAKPAERRACSQSILNTTFSFYQAYQVHHQNVKCIIILNYLKTEAIHFRYIIIL